MKEVFIKGGEELAFESQIDILHDMPHAVFVMRGDCGKDELLRLSVLVALKTKKHVVAYLGHGYGIDSDYRGGVVYRDSAAECFASWHKKAHFVVADNKTNDYRQTRLLFLHYHGGTLHNSLFGYFQNSFSKIIDPFGAEDEEQGIEAFELIKNPVNLTKAFAEIVEKCAIEESPYRLFQVMYIDDVVNVEKNGDRWVLSLPVTEEVAVKVWKIFSEGKRFTGKRPSTEMWIDVKDGRVIDFQHPILDLLYH